MKQIMWSVIFVVTFTFSLFGWDNCEEWVGGAHTYAVNETCTYNGQSYICVVAASAWENPTSDWFWDTISGCGYEEPVISPVNGSTISDTTFTIGWDEVAGASGYQIWVGTSYDAGDILVAGGENNIQREYSIDSIPDTVQTIYVRLDVWHTSGIKNERIIYSVSNSSSGDTLNLAPVDITISTSSVDKFSEPGTIVGLFEAIDPNISDSHAFEFSTGAGDDYNSLFILKGDTLVTNAVFSYFVLNQYPIRIKAVDDSGLTFEKELIVTVTDTSGGVPSLDSSEVSVKTEITAEQNNSLSFKTTITNHSDGALDGLVYKYFLNWADHNGPLELHLDWSNVPGLSISTNEKNNYIAEAIFDLSTYTLPVDGEVVISGRLNCVGYGEMDFSNDYSYFPMGDSINSNVAVYRSGSLIYGIEPSAPFPPDPQMKVDVKTSIIQESSTGLSFKAVVKNNSLVPVKNVIFKYYVNKTDHNTPINAVIDWSEIPDISTRIINVADSIVELVFDLNDYIIPAGDEKVVNVRIYLDNNSPMDFSNDFSYLEMGNDSVNSNIVTSVSGILSGGNLPYNLDSDGDGYPDIIEMQMGTDPYDPNSYPRDAQGDSNSVKMDITLITDTTVEKVVYYDYSSIKSYESRDSIPIIFPKGTIAPGIPPLASVHDTIIYAPTESNSEHIKVGRIIEINGKIAIGKKLQFAFPLPANAKDNVKKENIELLHFDSTLSQWETIVVDTIMNGAAYAEVESFSPFYLGYKFIKKSVTSGKNHSVAVEPNGDVYSFGDNKKGQLGVGAPFAEVANKRSKVTLLRNAVQLEAGDDFTIALDFTGTVWAWGDNSKGQIGIGSTQKIYATPMIVPIGEDVIYVSAGANHALAVTVTGKVYSWGSNSHGQLGLGVDDGFINIVTQISKLHDITYVAAGNAHSIATQRSSDRSLYPDSIWAWGDNSKGQLWKADITGTSVNTPKSFVVSLEKYRRYNSSKISYYSHHSIRDVDARGDISAFRVSRSTKEGTGWVSVTAINYLFGEVSQNIVPLAFVDDGFAHYATSKNPLSVTSIGNDHMLHRNNRYSTGGPHTSYGPNLGRGSYSVSSDSYLYGNGKNGFGQINGVLSAGILYSEKTPFTEADNRNDYNVEYYFDAGNKSSIAIFEDSVFVWGATGTSGALKVVERSDESAISTITFNSSSLQSSGSGAHTISGTVSPSGAVVKILLDGIGYSATVSGTSWSFSVPTTLAAGKYDISASVKSGAAVIGFSEGVFYNDIAIVRIISPRNVSERNEFQKIYRGRIIEFPVTWMVNGATQTTEVIESNGEFLPTLIRSYTNANGYISADTVLFWGTKGISEGKNLILEDVERYTVSGVHSFDTIRVNNSKLEVGDKIYANTIIVEKDGLISGGNIFLISTDIIIKENGKILGADINLIVDSISVSTLGTIGTGDGVQVGAPESESFFYPFESGITGYGPSQGVPPMYYKGSGGGKIWIEANKVDLNGVIYSSGFEGRDYYETRSESYGYGGNAVYCCRTITVWKGRGGNGTPGTIYIEGDNFSGGGRVEGANIAAHFNTNTIPLANFENSGTLCFVNNTTNNVNFNAVSAPYDSFTIDATMEIVAGLEYSWSISTGVNVNITRENLILDSLVIDGGVVTQNGNLTCNEVVIKNGGTLTLNGNLTCNNIVLKNGGTLTHDFEAELTLNVANAVNIDTNSSINLDGKGDYGVDSKPTSLINRSIFDPFQFGTGNVTGSRGGGALLLEAGSIILNGSISVNGVNGGSGGGLLIDCQTLSGTGTISANGTSTYGDGGRIRLSTDNMTLPLTNIGFSAGDANSLSGILLHTNSVDSSGVINASVIGKRPEMEFVDTIPTEYSYYDWNIKNVAVSLSPNASKLLSSTLVFDNCDVTVDSTFSCENLLLTNYTTVTHSSFLADTSVGVYLNITDTLTIDSYSSIDLTGLGYVGDAYFAGKWLGARSVQKKLMLSSSSSDQVMGGTYGGKSDNINSQGFVYGNKFAPTSLGSGAGALSSSESNIGGNGGGRLKIESAILNINGSILANGGVGSAGYGGGSGGSVFIMCDTISGDGSIYASGGTGLSNSSGSGGRIAVYSSKNEMSVDSVIADSGTVYLADKSTHDFDSLKIVFPAVDTTIDTIGLTVQYTFNETVHEQSMVLDTGTHEIVIDACNYLGTYFADTINVKVELSGIAPFIKAAPLASTTYGEAPLKVKFSAKGKSSQMTIHEYSLEVGNGGTGWDKNSVIPFSYEYEYTEPGEYVAYLEVKAQNGRVDTAFINITVTGGLKAFAEATPTNGGTPLNVEFAGWSDANKATPLYHKWDFDGDGNFDTVINVATDTVQHYNCGFENGIGDWDISSGGFIIETASTDSIWSTNRGVEYDNLLDGTLTSTEIVIPDTGSYNLIFNQNYMSEEFDFGYLYISDDQDEQDTLKIYSGNIGESKEVFNLDSYLGKTIKVNFNFFSDWATNDKGWEIDSMLVKHSTDADTLFSSVVERDDSWSTSGDECWQKIPVKNSLLGTGTQWVRTLIGGDDDYENSAIYSMESPLVSLEAGHKYSLSFSSQMLFADKNDKGHFEISENTGNLKRLYNFFNDINGDKKEINFDISDFAGDEIKLKFVFTSDDSGTAPGWLIDNISIRKEREALLQDSIVVFEDNFNSNTLTGWDLGQEHGANPWSSELVSSTNYRLSLAYNNTVDSINCWIESQEIILSAGSPELSFTTDYLLPNNAGFWLEVSVNSGDYRSVTSSSTTSGNITIDGKTVPVINGTSGEKVVTYDFSRYSGNRVKFRIRCYNNSVGSEGFLNIDDLKIIDKSITSKLSYTYSSEGSYQAQFAVEDVNGTLTYADSNQLKIIVGEAGSPTVYSYLDVDSGDAPLTVNFEAIGVDNGTISRYEWDFDGDGVYDYSSTTTGNVTHTYQNAGKFVAKVRVTDNDGLKSTEQHSVHSKANLSLVFADISRTFEPNIDGTGGYSIGVNSNTDALIKIVIKDSSNIVVRTLAENNSITANTLTSYSWNGWSDPQTGFPTGKQLPAGPYFAVLEYEVGNETGVIDLTRITGGDVYRTNTQTEIGGQLINPVKLTYSPTTINPIDNAQWHLNITLAIPLDITLYIGSTSANNVRYRTIVDAEPMGAGAYDFYWDGLQDNGKMFDNWTLSYANPITVSLPKNSIWLKSSAPEVTGISTTPSRFYAFNEACGSEGDKNGVTVSYNLEKDADRVSIDVYETTTMQKVWTKELSGSEVTGGDHNVFWTGQFINEKNFIDKAIYRISITAFDALGNASLVRYNLIKGDYKYNSYEGN
jgi:hypothetical protein